MGALGNSLELAFKIKAEGADTAAREIEKVPRAVKEADKAATSGAMSTEKLSSAFQSLAPLASSAGVALGTIAAATTAVVYGFGQIILSASRAGAALQGAIVQTGLSAETLTTLGYNAQLAGQSLEQVLDPVKEFTRLIGEAGNGSKEAVEKMKRLGLEPAVALQDLDKALTQTLKKLGEMPNSVTKTNLAMDAFGEQGVVVLRFLDRFNGDLDKARAEAEKLGIVMSGEAAKGAAEFNRSLITVQAQLTALTHQFGREFLPVIGNGLEQISLWLAANKGEVSAWGQNFSDTMRGVAEVMNFTRGAVLGLENTFSGFFGASLQGGIAWAGSFLLNVLDPIGSAIARLIDGLRTLGAARRKAEGTAEGEAGIVNTSDTGGSTSASGGILTGAGGGGGRGGGGRGGRARGGGGGGGARVETAAEKAAREAKEALDAENDRVAAQERADDRLLELAQSEMEERLALARKEVAEKTKTQEEYTVYLALNQRAQKMFEVELLQSRLELIKLNAEERKEIEAEISKLETEIRVNAIDEEVEALENKSEILQEIADRYTKIRDESLKAQQAEQNAKAEQLRFSLEIAVRDAKNANQKRQAIEQLAAFELADLQRKEAQDLADIENRRQRDLDKLTDLEKQKGLEKEINDRARAEEIATQEEYNATEIELAQKKRDDLAGVAQDTGNAFVELFRRLQSDESIQGFSGTIDAIGGKVVEMMENMGNAVGSAIQQWALYGGSVGKALKQALAAELAYLAGWAAVQALRATAWGFLMLAQMNFVAAGNAFVSAGIFAALAGGSALAARALSGGGKQTQNQAYDFRANTVSSNNSTSAAGNTTQMLSESRTMRQDQRITLEVQSRDSHIVRVVGDNLNQRGDLAPIVVKFVEQN